MSKGNRNRDKRKNDDAKVAAAFAQKLPLAAPLRVPGQAPMQLTAATLADELPAKALNREVGKRLAKANEQFYETELACILWALHKYAGWGKRRLMAFTVNYRPIVEELTSYYEYDYSSEDAPYACVRALKDELGIDVHELKNLEVL